MWPDGIAITRISLTLSGIEEIDIVDEAILVVIILREIHSGSARVQASLTNSSRATGLSVEEPLLAP